jgi:hypothetical protein
VYITTLYDGKNNINTEKTRTVLYVINTNTPDSVLIDIKEVSFANTTGYNYKDELDARSETDNLKTIFYIWDTSSGIVPVADVFSLNITH